jgi:aminodeoxyfutalosine synthase
VNPLASDLHDIETELSRGAALPRERAEPLLATADLLSLGVLGETARKARSGDRVTYGRVCTIADGDPREGRVQPGATTPLSFSVGWGAADPGQAGEVRLIGTPDSADEARRWTREARRFAGDLALTGFSLADLLGLCGGDHLALADLARALRTDGLESIAEAPLDGLGDTENAVEVLRAVQHGGLGAWRATIAEAAPDRRLDLIERAVIVQRDTGAFRAFAPLPRRDPPETPATGYDDVRTIAAARLMCDVPAIQVDWPLYGPKLAQVAIAYGANDIDGIAPADSGALGPRRAPKEDIERQIRAAFAQPVERDGRYAPRAATAPRDT